MNWQKIFRLTVFMSLIGLILSFAAVTHAEIYSGKGSYVMNEGENLGVAKERAKADAMRNASEKAGVYVKSYTRARNFELEEDIIETMTANILKLVDAPKFLPYEQLDNLEGLLIRVVVKVQIDDSDINRWLNKNEQEKSTLVAQNEALRKANADQERQIAELKRQLADNPQDREQLAKKFSDADKNFLSNQKVDESRKLFSKGDYIGMIKLCNEAIDLNPDNALAYNGRGVAYDVLKQYEQSIQDFNKAIQLNPNFDYAYNNRGNAYLNQQQYDRAIADYNYAIKINPNFALAYNNRGFAYFSLRQYEQAIQDFNKAIQLNPNDVMAYTYRGFIYGFTGNFKQGIADANKAIELNPKFDLAYQLRGLCYRELGDNAKAQADFDKAKQLGYSG